MTFAACVGSYALPQFVELNIRALRHVFGNGLPILVSDDISEHSGQIRDLAAEMDVHHVAGGPRGHFAGDANCCVNALAFAESVKADVALKISQRLVLCEPVCREIIERYFSEANISLTLPGRIPPGTIKRAESRFFSSLSVQSDILAIRTGTISPAELKESYEGRVRNTSMRHASLIEGWMADLIDTRFNHKFAFMPELTAPYPGRAPLYLRKCQSEPADYQTLADRLGMKSPNWTPILVEWRQMSNGYRPCPVFI